MEPDNRKIFAALIGLLDQLSSIEIERAFRAAGPHYEQPRPLYVHSQEGAKQDALNRLRIAWDAEQTRNEPKARWSLVAIAKRLSEDVGEDRVQTALREYGCQLVDNEFVQLEPGENVVLPPTGQLELSSIELSSTPPEVRTGRVTVGLDAKISAKGFVSDPDAVPVKKVRVEHEISHTRLLQLRETLNGFHGFDAPEMDRLENTEEAPLSQDDLKVMRAVIAATIDLHEAPIITPSIKEMLKVAYQFLVEMKERLDKLSETYDSLKSLAFKVGEAVLAIKELLDIVSGL